MFKFNFLKLFILIFNLVSKTLFRILMLKDSSFSFTNFRLKNFDFLIKISSFFCEFLVDCVSLVTGTILKISIRFFKFLEILIFILDLLHHNFVLFLDLSDYVLHVCFDGSFLFFKSIVVIFMTVRHFIESIFILLNLTLHLFIVKTFGILRSLFNLLLFIVIEGFDLRKLLSRLLLMIRNKFINFVFLFLKLSFEFSFFILKSLFGISRRRTNLFL